MEFIQYFKNASNDVQNMWLTDTRPSVHMSFQSIKFKSLKLLENEVTVQVADNKVVKAEDIGDVDGKVYDVWLNETIINVLFIPEFRKKSVICWKID